MVGLQIRCLEYWAIILMNVGLVFAIEMALSNLKILN